MEWVHISGRSLLGGVLCAASLAACSSPQTASGPAISRGTLAPSAATVAPSGPAPTAPPGPGPSFTGTATEIPPEVRQRMAGHSWRPGCPVGLDDLRLVSLTHRGFDGQVHTGQMVVHRDHVAGVIGVFHLLFATGFPIERMQLVEDFGADDAASMAANNTSAFNCRGIDGRPGVWSQHSYGWAIDINPVQNPWVRGSRVDPPSGAPFTDRAQQAPGMIHAGDVAVQAFASIGWTWGGTFQNAKDYQHFSASGL